MSISLEDIVSHYKLDYWRAQALIHLLDADFAKNPTDDIEQVIRFANKALMEWENARQEETTKDSLGLLRPNFAGLRKAVFNRAPEGENPSQQVFKIRKPPTRT